MKKYGFVQKLVVKLDDTDLLQVSTKFLEDIEKNFKNFQKEYQDNEKEWKEYLNSENFVFEPEKLVKRSPLTIINAPWGTGKTYFIENFMKLFIDQKLTSNIFKKIMIIDAWKFSNSKDVPVEFAFELSKRLIKIQANTETDDVKKDLKQRILNWIIPESLTWTINFWGFVQFQGKHTKKNQNLEEQKPIKDEEKWAKIANNEEATIIFIDNLERLGSASWDLLKAVLKLQEFKNYLIVLPLNLNKLSNKNRVDNSEYPIEKYIDFNYYDFEQDYSHFFSKTYQDQNLIRKLNLIFNTDIEGEKLSIREVENSFKTKNLFSLEMDSYEILKVIKDEIWAPKNIFDDIYRNDIKNFLELELERKKIYWEVAREIIKRNSKGQLINIDDLDKEEINNIIISDWNNNIINFYKVNFNYLDEYNKIFNQIKKQKEKNELEYNKIFKDSKKIINQINRYKNSIKKLETDSDNLDLEISKVNTKENYNAKEHQSLIDQKSLLKTKISELNNDIFYLKTVYNENEKEMNFLKENEKLLFFSIESLITKLSKINEKDYLSNEQKTELLKILKENYPNEDFNKVFSSYDVLQSLEKIQIY